MAFLLEVEACLINTPSRQENHINVTTFIIYRLHGTGRAPAEPGCKAINCHVGKSSTDAIPLHIRQM